MNRIPLTAVVLATALLGGCATYDYVGNTAPGGYYHGRPTVEYYDAYGGYYGGGAYGGYYSGPYRYRGTYGYPYYGYYGPYYPYYRPHYPPRPPRPGHGDDHPKPPATGGDRPPPWRDPTGVYRDSGSQPMIPHRSNRVTPAPSQPAVRSGEGQRPGRVMSSPAMPRASERPQPVQRSAPPRAERPAPASRPASIPRGRLPSQQER